MKKQKLIDNKTKNQLLLHLWQLPACDCDDLLKKCLILDGVDVIMRRVLVKKIQRRKETELIKDFNLDITTLNSYIRQALTKVYSYLSKNKLIDF